MTIVVEKKKGIIEQFHRNEKDTGSPEVQIALLTERINGFTQHLKGNLRDHHSRHGLLKMVSRRKRLLDYLKRVNRETYQNVIARLDLRK